MSVINSVKQILAKNRTLYDICKEVYVMAFVRFYNKKNFIRSNFFKKLKNISSFIVQNELMGGSLTADGEFYIRTGDDICLYYNFGCGDFESGDGQSLDFKSHIKDDPVEALVMRHLRDSAVYFDIGANNGYYYSLKVAKRLPNSKVYAFEPDQKILYHLRKNIKFNVLDNIVVIPYALTDYIGVAEITDGLGASNYLASNTNLSGAPTRKVECNTLDNFIAKNNIDRLDFIKVDIEGGEYRFLKGAKRSIERFKPVMILELTDKLLQRNSSSTETIIDFLNKLQFKCFRINGSSDVLILPSAKTDYLTEDDRKRIREIK